PLSQVILKFAMEINIHEWTTKDLTNIRLAWLRHYKNVQRSDMIIRRDAESATQQWLKSRFQETGSFGLVAECDSFAGFLIGRICVWESDPPIIKPRRIGIIDALYVSEQFRQRGIGSLLIEKALLRMQAARATAVEVTYDIREEASVRTWRHARFEPWMVHAYRML